MTCLNPSGKRPSSPACSLDAAGLQLWELRGARLVLTGFGCGLGNLAGADAQILPSPIGIHSALPCAGAKDHHQGLGFQGPPCEAGMAELGSLARPRRKFAGWIPADR